MKIKGWVQLHRNELDGFDLETLFMGSYADAVTFYRLKRHAIEDRCASEVVRPATLTVEDTPRRAKRRPKK